MILFYWNLHQAIIYAVATIALLNNCCITLVPLCQSEVSSSLELTQHGMLPTFSLNISSYYVKQWLDPFPIFFERHALPIYLYSLMLVKKLMPCTPLHVNIIKKSWILQLGIICSLSTRLTTIYFNMVYCISLRRDLYQEAP